MDLTMSSYGISWRRVPRYTFNTTFTPRKDVGTIWIGGSQSRFILRNEKKILSVYWDSNTGLQPVEYRNNNDITFQYPTNPQTRQK